MFSTRFHWDTRPNRLTRLLNEKRSAGADIFDLTESNPTQAGLIYPPDLMRAFDDPRNLTYNPAPAGAPEARDAVASYYSARGVNIDPARILLTASTSEGYAYLFKLLADPGDHVLVPRPSYPLFEYLANMESIEVRQYPLEYHGAWSIDRDALAAAIDSRTRAIVLVNPNNPTGSYVKRAELEFLASLGLPLISDEVFADYSFAPDSDRVWTLAGTPNAFVMSGLSKIAGLPQMKLGWIVAASSEAVERLEWIADTYLSVSTPVQCAAARLLAVGEDVQRQIRERAAANLACARAALANSPASILAVEGGWYITIRLPRVNSEEEWALELLGRDNVLVQPGYFYDFETEAFAVVSLLTRCDVFEEGIRRMARRAESAAPHQSALLP